VSATPTLDALQGIVRRHKEKHWHAEAYRFHVSLELWRAIYGTEGSPDLWASDAKKNNAIFWRGITIVLWTRRQHREADLRVNGDVVGTFKVPTSEDA
jgi:hypothetical protein